MALFVDLVALSNGLHGSVQMDLVALFSWIGWLRHHGIFINNYQKLEFLVKYIILYSLQYYQTYWDLIYILIHFIYHLCVYMIFYYILFTLNSLII